MVLDCLGHRDIDLTRWEDYSGHPSILDTTFRLVGVPNFYISISGCPKLLPNFSSFRGTDMRTIQILNSVALLVPGALSTNAEDSGAEVDRGYENVIEEIVVTGKRRCGSWPIDHLHIRDCEFAELIKEVLPKAPPGLRAWNTSPRPYQAYNQKRVLPRHDARAGQVLLSQSRER